MDKKLRSASLWYAFGVSFYLGCQWLLSIVVVRLSGYYDAGLLSLAMSIANIYFNLSIFGMRNFQVADLEEKISGDIYVTSRILTITGAYALLVIFVLCNRYDAEAAGAIFLYCLYRTSEAAVDVLHGIDQKKGRLDAAGKSHALRGPLFLLVFSLTLYLGFSLQLALLFMAMVMAAVVAIYDYPIAERLSRFRIRFDWPQIGILLKKCLPLLTYSLILIVASSIPRLALERIQGSEMLGYYASVATPAVIVQTVASYLYTPLIPSYAAAFSQRDKNTFFRLTRNVSVYIALLGVAALLFEVLAGEFALALVFGEPIRPYAYLFGPAVVGTILTAYTWFLCMLLTVAGDRKGLMIASLVALTTSILLSAPFILSFGLQGTNFSNIAMLLTELIALLIRFWQISKRQF